MIKNKIIYVDFDSTIINTSKTLFNIYKRDTGSEEEFPSEYTWEFDGLFPESYKQTAYSYFLSPEFYDFVEFNDNAVNVLEKLSIDNTIIICTKHHELRKPLTEKFVSRTMPFIKKIKYVNSFDKSECVGDIFIDDRIDALSSVCNNFPHIICFGNYDWNKEWKGVRVSNWDELELLIGSL